MERRVVKDVKKLYALKEIDQKKFIRDDRMKEVFIEKRVLSDLDHPSIIKFHESFASPHKLYFLLEHCPGKSLHEFLAN